MTNTTQESRASLKGPCINCRTRTVLVSIWWLLYHNQINKIGSANRTELLAFNLFFQREFTQFS